MLSLASLTNFIGMMVSLWLAAYLLARGFPSRVTLRAVLVLGIVAGYFLNTYLTLYDPSPGARAWQSSLITAGLTVWYDLTYNLLPPSSQARVRPIAVVVYVFGFVTFMLLAGLRPFANWDFDNPIGTAQAGPWLLIALYGTFVIVAMAAALYNFRLGGQRDHHGPGTWAASLLAAVAIAFGILGLALNVPALWISQGVVLMVGVCLLGYSVVRRQLFIERGVTFQEFPISGLAILGLAALYALLGRGQNLTPRQIAFLTVLAILTHSAYDLAREFLDRLLHRRESALRSQLRALAQRVGSESSLQSELQAGLAGLCRTLNTYGGFIAVRDGDSYVVSASLNSLPAETRLASAEVAGDDLHLPPAALIEQVAWLAPAFSGGEQVAVVGLGTRWSRGKYSEGDLDLLGETADWVGRVVRAHWQEQDTRQRLTSLTAEAQSSAQHLQAEAAGLMTAVDVNPDSRFLGWVEDALRNLVDYPTLGQSPLPVLLGVQGSTHIESGKAVRECLAQAIDRLRPAGPRPAEPLPREWHSYAILHDAYMQDVPNREIMAQLYISEGTFHRTRRKALRAVARNLLELKAGG